MTKTVGIILAAGSAQRMGENKMLLNIGGRTVLERSMIALSQAECFDSIVVVCRKEDEPVVRSSASAFISVPFSIVYGGDERQHSVANALNAVGSADIVAIHDGARCFVKPQVIRDCVDSAKKTGAAAAGVRTTDTIKRTKDGVITETLDRSELINIQTPQAFSFELIRKAHKLAKEENFLGTDECILIENMGLPVTFIESSYDNIKITTLEDIAMGRLIAGERVRIGTGYDAHKLKKGLRLVLGGETIPHSHGLIGHSDADVLLHAIMDAMLGAVASRDIGHHFPCIDEFKDSSSLFLLSETVKIVEEQGYNITGIDSTVVLELPKLSPYIDNMRVKIAEATGLDVKYVSVKATTTEGLGFEGKREGIAAMATVTVIG